MKTFLSHEDALRLEEIIEEFDDLVEFYIFKKEYILK